MNVFSFVIGIFMLLMSAYWMFKDDWGRANWFVTMAVCNFIFALH
jgi:uncharacterized membrane protein